MTLDIIIERNMNENTNSTFLRVNDAIYSYVKTKHCIVKHFAE